MSRLYFDSPSGRAELAGSEYAWLKSLVDDLFTGVMSIRCASDTDRLTQLINPAHYLANPPPARRFLESVSGLNIALTSPSGNLLMWRGHPLDTFALRLNTALAVGSDPVRLAAVLSGQGEIHAWVDGPNRAWLADIMQAGLDAGVYRTSLRLQNGRVVDQGWPDVIAFLRSGDDEPVVTSYSGSDYFPNPELTGQVTARRPGQVLTDEQETHRETQQARFDELDAAEQWRAAMHALRNPTDPWPWGSEIRPATFGGFRFGHGLSALDLHAYDRDARLDAALLNDVDGRR